MTSIIQWMVGNHHGYGLDEVLNVDEETYSEFNKSLITETRLHSDTNEK
jgi:hypothetical protein